MDRALSTLALIAALSMHCVYSAILVLSMIERYNAAVSQQRQVNVYRMWGYDWLRFFLRDYPKAFPQFSRLKLFLWLASLLAAVSAVWFWLSAHGA